MTCNNIKKQLMAVRFSIWDLHLYLDSHPNDEMAKSLIEKYSEKYKTLLRDYEAQFGALTDFPTYETKCARSIGKEGEC